MVFEDNKAKLNEGADHWYYIVGVPTLPGEYKTKKTKEGLDWLSFQTNPPSKEQHEIWKRNGDYIGGVFIMSGLIEHSSIEKLNGKYLVSFDFDKQKAFDDFKRKVFPQLATMSDEEIAKELMMEHHEDAPDRKHTYLVSPFPFPNQAPNASGIEIKSYRNGIIRVTPSITEKGYSVKFIGTNIPQVISTDTADKMLKRLDDLFREYNVDYLEKTGKNSGRITPEIKKMIIEKGITDESKKNIRIPEGERHPTLVSIANSIIMVHLSKDRRNELQLQAFFNSINNTLCRNKLGEIKGVDDQEISDIWNDCMNWAGPRRDQWLEDHPDNKEGYTSGGNQGGGYDEDSKKLFRKKILKNLYEMIIDKYTFKAMIDTGEILYYDTKKHRYVFNGETIIKIELEKLWPDAFWKTVEEEAEDGEEPSEDTDPDLMPLAEGEREEIVKRIRYRFPVERKDFDANPEIINVKNGFLHIEIKGLKDRWIYNTGLQKWEDHGEDNDREDLDIITRHVWLEPHNPEYLSIKQFSVNYDPTAKSKRLTSFLREIQDTKGIIVLAKMLGYILISSSKYEKAFMFLGEGDNGKSVLIYVIECFAGEDNCSHVKLHDISDDKFMLAELAHKVVNTYADISGAKIKDSGIFKAVVSGDKIPVQRKYEHPFWLSTTSKLIYSANNLPQSDDDNVFAYFKRWVVLSFKSFFKGVNKDRCLKDKLTTDNELSCLLNLAIGGLLRLEYDGGFDDISLEEIRNEYQEKDISFDLFVKEYCHIDLSKKAEKDIYMIADDFDAKYIEFIERRNKDTVKKSKPLDRPKIEIELSKLGVFKKRKTIDGKKYTVYKGIITTQEAANRNMQILALQKQTTFEG